MKTRAIFYRNDGEKIPNPGIIVIGKIDSGVARLDVSGSVKVRLSFTMNNNIEERSFSSEPLPGSSACGSDL